MFTEMHRTKASPVQGEWCSAQRINILMIAGGDHSLIQLSKIYLIFDGGVVKLRFSYFLHYNPSVSLFG